MPPVTDIWEVRSARVWINTDDTRVDTDKTYRSKP